MIVVDNSDMTGNCRQAESARHFGTWSEPALVGQVFADLET